MFAKPWPDVCMNIRKENNMKTTKNTGKKKSDTCAATINGKNGRVTIPENDESCCQKLFEAIREQLSPEAVASIIAHLQPAHTNDQDVDREVRWFAAELTKLVGGNERVTELMEELNL